MTEQSSVIQSTLSKETGIVYYGTELYSPDFSEGKCTAHYNKCMGKPSATKAKCMRVCHGARYVTKTQDGQSYLRGTIVDKQKSGISGMSELNQSQAEIINWFLENSQEGGHNSKAATLPFRFSWSAGTCLSLEDDFNCQQFTGLFRNDPERLKRQMKIGE